MMEAFISYAAAAAAGSAPTALNANIPAHKIVIEEDGLTLQGLTLTYPQDGFVQAYTYAPGAPVTLLGHGRDGIVGRPAAFGGSAAPTDADVYAKVTSATPVATNVRLIEFPLGAALQV